jgi:hypothetical protein
MSLVLESWSSGSWSSSHRKPGIDVVWYSSTLQNHRPTNFFATPELPIISLVYGSKCGGIDGFVGSKMLMLPVR